jgi:hypothetical protein
MNMYKDYSGFRVCNFETCKETIYPYIKGEDSRDTEDRAIREQMRLTGLPRSNFIINGLVKR